MRGFCIECQSPGILYRPVVREVDGWVRWVCRVCWFKYDYGSFMYNPPTEEDQRLMNG